MDNPRDATYSNKEELNQLHPPEREEHLNYRNYMRDVILGANDGLVSIFALVLGVAGGGFLPRSVLIAGIAGAVAGAISMAIGEYLSTKSQEQVYDAEEAMEREHIRTHREHEIEELYEFYTNKGFKGKLLDQVVETIAADDDVLVREMMMAEFGVLEEERRSPLTATIIVGIAFVLGSLPPVIPFVFVNQTFDGILIAASLSVVGLFIVGALKANVTRTNIWGSGGENMALGLAGAIITYLIGSLFDNGLAI